MEVELGVETWEPHLVQSQAKGAQEVNQKAQVWWGVMEAEQRKLEIVASSPAFGSMTSWYLPNSLCLPIHTEPLALIWAGAQTEHETASCSKRLCSCLLGNRRCGCTGQFLKLSVLFPENLELSIQNNLV